MGPCQIYSVTLIYLQGEAEIQTVKKKQVPQAGSAKKKVVVFFFLCRYYSSLFRKACEELYLQQLMGT